MISEPKSKTGKGAALAPTHKLSRPDTRVYVGDCREVLPALKDTFDLIFADPPFNWKRDYDRWEEGGAWDDDIPEREYLDFTEAWLDLCIDRLAAHGAMWVNIPDTWAAEIVVHLKKRKLKMVNWCVWHYRFGQNTKGRFINSKVHALYFMKDPEHPDRRWNAGDILELSDRRAIYKDKRTETKKDGIEAGHRVPMDVWYGQHWGRVQGNNKERRHKHDNQLPEVYLGRVVAGCSHEGDRVLDPFLGSGTTGVVCRALKRKFVGIDFSELNAEHAFDRIKAGPARTREQLLEQLKGQSTAIHPKRVRGVETDTAV
ncbi:MAG: DNA methyltransferase [Planctomycetota bacterium]